MALAVARKIFLDRADRLQRMPVPPDDLARAAGRLQRRGVDVIDLSRIGASSIGTDERLRVAEASAWQPASAAQLEALRTKVAEWYDRRFGVKLEADREITFASNSILALHLLATAFLDAGDLALLPDPGAPFYRGAVVLAGGGVIPYNLLERNDYLPSFGGLEAGLVGRVRLMVVSYPHNPTTAVADLATMTRTVAFAKKNNILIAFDGAFTYGTAGAFRPRTLLEAAGAKGVGVEFCDLGANFGLADFPLTVVCGNREAVSATAFLLDAAQLQPSSAVVETATALLTHGEKLSEERARRLEASRRLLSETAAQLKWNPRTSPTLPFLWSHVRAAAGVSAFCRRMLRRTGLVMTPGTVFGECGDEFVRIVLPEDATVAQTASERLLQHARMYQRRVPRDPAKRTPRRRVRRGRQPGSSGTDTN